MKLTTLDFLRHVSLVRFLDKINILYGLQKKNPVECVVCDSWFGNCTVDTG